MPKKNLRQHTYSELLLELHERSAESNPGESSPHEAIFAARMNAVISEFIRHRDASLVNPNEEPDYDALVKGCYRLTYSEYHLSELPSGRWSIVTDWDLKPKSAAKEIFFEEPHWFGGVSFPSFETKEEALKQIICKLNAMIHYTYKEGKKDSIEEAEKLTIERDRAMLHLQVCRVTNKNLKEAA